MALLSGRLARPTALLLLGAATGARAHVIPIPPSVCRFDPLTFTVPIMGLTGAAAAAGPADAVRLVYDANASTVRLCPTAPSDASGCDAPVPRAFSLGTTTGTLTLPNRFTGVMVSSGDVQVRQVPLAFVVDGVTTTIPVDLGSGLAAADGTVAVGTPLQGIGGFTLVGRVDGTQLPPPLTGKSMTVTLTCQPRPIPDKDQFVPPSRLRGLRGRLGTAGVALRTQIAVGQADRPAFVGQPLLLALQIDEQTVATAVVSGGLVGRRRLDGTSDDGRAVVSVRRRSAGAFGLAVDWHDLPLAALAPGSRHIVRLAVQTTGMLARGERLFRAR